MRSPVLGRIRWFGKFPKPTEIANYPVQSALADVMNARMLRLAADFDQAHGYGTVRTIAQVHDAATYEVPRDLVADVKARIQAAWDEPVQLAGGGVLLPIDLKTGGRWNDF